MTELEWINIGGKYSYEDDLRFGLAYHGMFGDVGTNLRLHLKWPLQSILDDELGSQIQHDLHFIPKAP